MEAELESARREREVARSELVSLEALQKAALGEADREAGRWLQSAGLAGRPRVTAQIEVERGWERGVEAVLGDAYMTINKNGIPNDPEKPMVTSGVRIGTPAMTTRGFKEDEARATAHLVADVLDNPRDAANLDAVRAKVTALTSRFPVYG